jgi:O-antigen/teichoic acid export membrane protein
LSEGKKLASASVFLMVATGVMNLSMVAYHRVMSANLGDAYAQLAALTGVVNLAAVISNGMGTYLARTLSRDAALSGSGGVRLHFRRMIPGLGVLHLGLAAGLLALGPWVVNYLRLPSFSFYALGVAYALSILTLTCMRSILQGLQRYMALGWVLMVEGLGRVVFGAMLVFSGWGPSGALMGSLGAAGLTFLTGGLGLRSMGPEKEPPQPPKGQAKRRQRLLVLVLDTATLGLFALLCYLDVFIAKHYWGEAEAASFSRMALVGKSFLYAGSALVVVLLPATTTARAKGRDPRPILAKLLAAHAALLGFGLAFVWFMTPLVIRLLCGPQQEFQVLASGIRAFSLAVVPLALYQLVMMYQLSVAPRAAAIVAAVLALGYGGALLRWHDNSAQVIGSLGICATLALIAALFLAFSRTGAEPGTEQEGLDLVLQDHRD